jgi:hypothetical protein
MAKASTRHLRRRQLYLRHMAIDLCHTAYTRAHQIRRMRRSPDASLITIAIADIDRDDNRELAQSARDLAAALQALAQTVAGDSAPPSNTLRRLILRTVMKFAGEPLDDHTLDAIMQDVSA